MSPAEVSEESCEDASCAFLCGVHILTGVVMVRCEVRESEAVEFIAQLATIEGSSAHALARSLLPSPPPTGDATDGLIAF